MKKLLLLTLIVTALSSCITTSGKDFSAPDAKKLITGITDIDDVLSIYGPPNKKTNSFISYPDHSGINNTTSNNECINYIYFYSETYSSDGIGLSSTESQFKQIKMSFIGKKLVSYRYTSSFKNASTKFDDNKLQYINIGRDTKSDIIKNFGNPNGVSIYPLVQPRGYEIYSYAYDKFDLDKLNKNTKTANIIFSAEGVVRDYQYVNEDSEVKVEIPWDIITPIIIRGR